MSDDKEIWEHYKFDDAVITWNTKEGETKRYFDKNYALGVLLLAEVLFCNQREYIEYDGKSYGTSTTVLFVLCNDIFMWACADGEPILNSEIESLFTHWHENKQWGAAKWCCIKRNEQPQNPVKDAMKKAGVWDEQMDALEPNSYQKYLSERAANNNG